MPAIPPFAVQSGEGKTMRTPTDDLVTVQGLHDVGLANWIEFIGPPLSVSEPL